jgi:hypothetical protein
VIDSWIIPVVERARSKPIRSRQWGLYLEETDVNSATVSSGTVPLLTAEDRYSNGRAESTEPMAIFESEQSVQMPQIVQPFGQA